MTDLPPDDAKWVAYLLGELVEAEAQGLEERWFADPEVTERLSVLEDELVEAHSVGRLSPERAARFEALYLTSAEGRNHRAVMDGIVDRAKRRHAERWHRTRSISLAVAAGLGAALVFIMQFPKALSISAPSPSIVRHMAPTPTPSVAAASVSPGPAPFLYPGTGRSDQGGQQVRVEIGALTVRLQAVLRGASRHDCCTASISRASGAPVWSTERPSLSSVGLTSILQLDIPSSRLPPGEYVLVLRDADGPVDTYDFRIVGGH